MKFRIAVLLAATVAASAQFPVAPVNNQYDVCTDFCKGALTVCEGTVDWVTGAVATPFSRHGDNYTPRGKSLKSPPQDLGKPQEQFGACHDTCMGWQYWRLDPGNWSERFFNGYTLGDSLNCRWNHLAFAQGIPSFYYGLQASESESGAQHCQHITPDGGWVCTDYRYEDGKTATQLYKEAFLKRRVGDCWLAREDTIADCHYKGLRDDTVGAALAWLPQDIEHIFLGANALTSVPDLSKFTKLKTIYLENNSIKQLQSADFASNPQLEVINLANNLIGKDTMKSDSTTDYTPPNDLLHANKKLKAFYIIFNYISEFPEDFFANCKEIEMIAVVENALTSLPPKLFKGLKKLKSFGMGQQGKGGPPSVGGKTGISFTEAGFPDQLFDDLESLEYLNNFINGFGSIKARWFKGTPNLEALVVFLNGKSAGRPTLAIEPGVFENLPKLIDFSSYSSNRLGFPGGESDALSPDDFKKNPNILSVSDGTQFLLAPEPLRNALGLPHPLGDDRALNPRPKNVFD
ncbi:hypothetical protein ACHAWO_012650 [Cyclotella atomus]|uniref:Uncharacterized protein n=1 Tax=Cyclotella atomus TaxID=382360 RepID=A0ABD3PMB0_9STRA